MAQQSIALMLNTEIANVVTAMRQNSKWALIPTRYSVSVQNIAQTSCRFRSKNKFWFSPTFAQDNEVGDDPLLDELKLLRRKLFHFPGAATGCFTAEPFCS